ncbi:DNA repair protein RecN [Candidatus Xianfuyuplasma coldseepsis]|uniref:DNA repair protein RecN n=1 Tax=Candidatus Xianfuyuplasma coldseepsis TaxID=2782163 RepID=A0A7L7KV98_9MOLU|nr:DNA repair protein RecN [Xianfuyuplasma coldseepsis]QMS85688.1 DNA repair protein RecN [Xianfuyuplasma coldseepsis]
MLTYISVQNFAIIENIEVTFHEGMTAVTGETGAGKSLLIDAIGLLLGDRATSNIVRTGSDKAVVEGIFQTDNPDIARLLQSLDIDQEQHELIIRRQITPNNNNIIKINNTVVTLKDLREITSKLADIHTQQDTHRLIQQDTYLDIIDGFERHQTDQLLETYHRHLATYKKERSELRRLQQANDSLYERLDLLKYQQKELTSYNLEDDEEETLQEAVEKMENYDRIYQVLQSIKQRIEGVDALGAIYQASKELGSISSLSSTYETLHKRFENEYYELDDVFETLLQEIDQLDFSPALMDQYQDRLNELDGLKRKYRKSIPELIRYLETITNDIDNIDHYDDVVREQEQKVKEAFETAVQTGTNITSLRQQTSHYIESELLRILTDLELPKTHFEIAFTIREPRDFTDQTFFLDNGIDEVDFLLTTNVGEPLKPLSKSASGGEMSRIMLGFKNLLANSLGLSLMIFDEIDTGVSGYIAFQVAKKMKEIAKNTQVICITHIPQVAAISEHHIHISKSVKEGRTRAHVTALDGEQRIEEIAGMISGDHITDAAIISATELLAK